MIFFNDTWTNTCANYEIGLHILSGCIAPLHILSGCGVLLWYMMVVQEPLRSSGRRCLGGACGRGKTLGVSAGRVIVSGGLGASSSTGSYHPTPPKGSVCKTSTLELPTCDALGLYYRVIHRESLQWSGKDVQYRFEPCVGHPSKWPSLYRVLKIEKKV